MSTELDEHIPEFLRGKGFSVIPKYNKFGKAITSVSIESRPEIVIQEEVTEVIEPTLVKEKPKPRVISVDGIEIPENTFLLCTEIGDIHYKPTGFIDEEMFLVLTFDNPEDLYFIPKPGTRFIAAFDAGETRYTYRLLYSGIKFVLTETDKTLVIFHKIS